MLNVSVDYETQLIGRAGPDACLTDSVTIPVILHRATAHGDWIDDRIKENPNIKLRIRRIGKKRGRGYSEVVVLLCLLDIPL